MLIRRNSRLAQYVAFGHVLTRVFSWVLFAVPCLPAFVSGADEEFELHDGARVVFIGNTMIERDQVHSYLETMLTARWPDRNIVFRNLGWSGDTVWGEARARFGTAADGLKHLQEHVAALQPTVAFVGYGLNESFQGPAGLPEFERGLRSLLEMVEGTGARVVLLSPLRQEDLGRPLPDPHDHNANLERYSKSISKVARERGHRFIDLFGKLSAAPENGNHVNLTDNGIHLTDYGHWKFASVVENSLGIAHPSPHFEVRTGLELIANGGVVVRELDRASKRVRFEAQAEILPRPIPPHSTDQRDLQPAFSLPTGRFTLNIDGRVVASSKQSHEVAVLLSPDHYQVETLRQTIIEKNRLYFHRWRPQNETYLFGFRKHEQGQNAAEVAQFDALIEAVEARIRELRAPQKHTYELIQLE